MGTVTNDVLFAEAQQTAGQGKQFTPDRIAALLDGWRPQVLREMGRRRLWRGADAAELEDQFQDVALVLCGRDFASEEHLRRALWTGLGFRAKDFWKAARRREIPVGEFFEEILGDDRLQAVEDAAATAADRRYVDDCLSELDPRERSVYKLARGEQLSRRRVAKTLRLSEAEVLRVLYRAQRKIDQVAVLAAAGRLCGRRRSAVVSLARGQARGLTLEQARAHLSHCPDCLPCSEDSQGTMHCVMHDALVPIRSGDGRCFGGRIVALGECLRGCPRVGGWRADAACVPMSWHESTRVARLGPPPPQGRGTTSTKDLPWPPAAFVMPSGISLSRAWSPWRRQPPGAVLHMQPINLSGRAGRPSRSGTRTALTGAPSPPAATAWARSTRRFPRTVRQSHTMDTCPAASAPLT